MDLLKHFRQLQWHAAHYDIHVAFNQHKGRTVKAEVFPKGNGCWSFEAAIKGSVAFTVEGTSGYERTAKQDVEFWVERIHELLEGDTVESVIQGAVKGDLELPLLLTLLQMIRSDDPRLTREDRDKALDAVTAIVRCLDPKTMLPPPKENRA